PAQLTDREHVQSGLHPVVLLPARHRVALAAALVVGDERVAVPRVDPVDLPAHAHALAELDRGKLAVRHAEPELELLRLEAAAAVGFPAQVAEEIELEPPDRGTEACLLRRDAVLGLLLAHRLKQ